jgi:chromosome segregation ATPase
VLPRACGCRPFPLAGRPRGATSRHDQPVWPRLRKRQQLSWPSLPSRARLTPFPRVRPPPFRADYGGSEGIELPPDAEGDAFNSPGSAYGDGQLARSSAAAARDEYTVLLEERERAARLALAQQQMRPATGAAGYAPAQAQRGAATTTGGVPSYASPPPPPSSWPSAAALLPAAAAARGPAGPGPSAASRSGVDVLQALANKPYLYTPESVAGGGAGGAPPPAVPPLQPLAPAALSTMAQHQHQQALQQQQHSAMTAADLNVSVQTAAAVAAASAAPGSVVTTHGTVILASAHPTDAGRLAVKVQAQAAQLADLAVRLRECEETRALVEKRLVEVAPSHPLPVTRDHLGAHVDRLSHLALAAAQTLAGASTPSVVAGATHVVAASATQRKEVLEQAKMIRHLEGLLEKDRKKLDDAVKRIRELKAACDQKEKDRANAIRRSEGLQQRVVSLEAEMRLAGMTVSAGAGAIPGHPSSASSAAAVPHPPSAAATAANDELAGRIAFLDAELAEARATRDATQESLSSERRESERLRAYAKALEAAVHGASGGGGAGGSLPDKAVLLTQVARLQGELEARAHDANDKESVIRDLHAQLREAQMAVSNLRGELYEAKAQAASAAATAASLAGPSSTRGGGGGGGAHASTPARNAGNLVIRSPVLGEISSQSHVNVVPGGAFSASSSRGFGGIVGGGMLVPGLAPGAALPQPVLDVLGRLESEKGALLDYVAELRDASTTLAAEKNDLLAQRADLSAQLQRARGDAEANGRAAAVAEAESGRLSDLLLDTQRRLATTDARLADVSSERARVTQDLVGSAEAMSELEGVRELLIDKIRDLSKEKDEAKKAAEAERMRAADAVRKVDSTEALLEQAEAERDSAEQRSRELRAQLESTQERVNSFSAHMDAANAELERLRGDRGSLEGRCRTLERRLEAVETAKAAEDEALKEAEVRANKATVEAETLSRTASAVVEVEAAASRFLRAHVGEGVGVVGVGGPADEEAAADDDGGWAGGAYDGEEGDVEVFEGSSGRVIVSPGKPRRAAGAAAGGSSSSSRRAAAAAAASSSASAAASGSAPSDAPALRHVDAAARAGRKASDRAEGALRWSTEASFNSAVPQVAAAARQLSGWLRLSGRALTDVSHRMAQELEDRRLQRRGLYEEIHALRDQLADTQDGLRTERSRAAESEVRATGLQRQLDADTSRLTHSLESAVAERDALRTRSERLGADLSAAQAEAGRAAGRIETLDAQLASVSTAHDRASKDRERLSNDLASTVQERDSLLDQISGLQQSLDEVRSHNSVLGMEKRALGDRMAAQEVALREAHGEVRALTERLSAAQREAQQAGARADGATTTLSARSEEALALKEEVARLSRAVADADDLANAQNEVLSQLTVQLRASHEQSAALNRGMAGMSVELESAKTALEAANDEFGDRVDAYIGGLRRLGVEVSPQPRAAGGGGGGGGSGSGSGAGMGGTSVSSAAAHFLALAESATAAVSGAPLTERQRQQHQQRQQQEEAQAAASGGFSQVQPLIARHRTIVTSLLHAGTTASTRITALLTEVGNLKGEIAALRPRVEAVQEVVMNANDKQRALTAADAAVSELRASLAAAESQIVTAQGEIATLRARMAEQSGELERASTRIAMLVSDAEAFREAERHARAELTDAQAHIGTLQDEINRMRREADTLVAQRCVMCVGWLIYDGGHPRHPLTTPFHGLSHCCRSPPPIPPPSPPQGPRRGRHAARGEPDQRAVGGPCDGGVAACAGRAGARPRE